MRTATTRTRRAAPTLAAALPLAPTAALTLALMLLVATPALAHPFVAGGGRVPVQSLATITLDLAHGCGVESPGAGPDTDEVALEVPEWLRIVDVPGPDGWRVTIEAAPDATDAGDAPDTAGETGVVVWKATTGAEPAPRFALDVVVDGEPGETRFLRVSQRCGDAVERWVGTPDEPAAQPAVRLRLEPADPASPPPPLPEPEPTPAPAPAPEPPPAPDVPAASSGELTAPNVTDAATEGTEGASTSGRRTAAIAAVGGALAVAAALAARGRGLRGGRAPSR